MSFVLHVDGERWRAGHDRFVADHPGVVPVIKGNGYGFGRDLLCAEATRLGVPMVAVGTYAELPYCPGGVRWRRARHGALSGQAVHSGLPRRAPTAASSTR